jgi:hypothetical protein
MNHGESALPFIRKLIVQKKLNFFLNFIQILVGLRLKLRF